MKKMDKILLIVGVGYALVVAGLATYSLLQTFVIQSADTSASVNNTNFGNKNSSSSSALAIILEDVSFVSSSFK
jgi:hypothetical protein